MSEALLNQLDYWVHAEEQARQRAEIAVRHQARLVGELAARNVFLLEVPYGED